MEPVWVNQARCLGDLTGLLCGRIEIVVWQSTSRQAESHQAPDSALTQRRSFSIPVQRHDHDVLKHSCRCRYSRDVLPGSSCSLVQFFCFIFPRAPVTGPSKPTSKKVLALGFVMWSGRSKRLRRPSSPSPSSTPDTTCAWDCQPGLPPHTDP